MFFNVSSLLQEGIGAARSHEVDAVVSVPGREPERLSGTVALMTTKTGVLVRAHLRLVEAEVCSRCLKPLEELVPLDFEEEFQVTVDPGTGAALPPPVDGDAFVIDASHVLDLSEAVRQYREVSLLMQPLCRADCKGLCPQCGKDLNLGDCACESGPASSAWAKLAALKGVVSEAKE